MDGEVLCRVNIEYCYFVLLTSLKYPLGFDLFIESGLKNDVHSGDNTHSAQRAFVGKEDFNEAFHH